MRYLFQRLCIVWLVFDAVGSYGQQQRSVDFYMQIKNYDLSKLLCADSLFMADAPAPDTMMEFPEPLGFIGDSFQRFYIHYTTVAQSPTDPYEYIVKGKTRVRDNIVPFSGKITIKKALRYYDDIYPEYKQGTVTFNCKFYEDSSLPFTGCITGTLETDWYLDKSGRIRYNTIYLAADGYSNNQFTGTWKSYKKHTVKKCNWGDFRIPGSKRLDHGAGAFCVDERYLHYGWQSFYDMDHATDTVKSKMALDKENEEWWK